MAELSQVHRSDWWERADAERIGQTYARARAWAPDSVEAARAAQKMRDELLDRYGLDLDRIDPRTVGAEVEAWQGRPDEQRQRGDGPRTAVAAERTEAAILLDQAAREDSHGAAAGEPGADGRNTRDGSVAGSPLLYDSAHRRAASARAMETQGIDPDVAEGRMRADTGVAKPATLPRWAHGGDGRPRPAERAAEAHAANVPELSAEACPCGRST
ncbi:MAG TPA: hypothetical protein VFP34_04690 [Microlunatus sp.]|nr:hypothetical protein [Microlunatus sp.]